ncbi:histidine kinase dimerization/phosphoacceptor domain -containing protein [Deltaproteobacteria bacterium TL4]
MKNEMDQHLFEENREVLTYLSRSRLFGHLDQERLKSLIPLVKIHRYSDGDKILSEGQFNDRVFFLTRGEVSIYASGELILTLKRIGDIFGEMSVISEKTCSATVVANGFVDLFSLQAQDIGQYSDSDSKELKDILYRLFAMILSEKLGMTTHKAQQYEATNRLLTQTKDALQKAHEELQKAHDQLEIRVEERTSELKITNEKLHQEIEERRRAEQRLQNSLKEKEVLLQEVHHRVKNNMAMVAAFLKLQIPKVKNRNDVELFLETQNRIQTMVLIHEKLYKTSDFSKIDFNQFINELTNALLASYISVPERITITKKVLEVSLDIQKAIPCGLIINELLSNVFKHAFKEGEKGTVQISFFQDNEGLYTLLVSDNGMGLPQDLDIRETEALGLQLVNILTDQLKGTIEIDRAKGTSFKIKFS